MSLFANKFDEACDIAKAAIDRGKIGHALAMYCNLRRAAEVVRDCSSSKAADVYKRMERRIIALGNILLEKSDKENLSMVIWTVGDTISALGIELLE